MAEITISFDKKGGAEELNILLNAQKIGSLSKGDMRTFHCDSGSHVIQLKNEKYTTNELKFDIEENQSKSFTTTKPTLFHYIRILFWLGLTSFFAHKAIGIGYYLFFVGVIGVFGLGFYSMNRYGLRIDKK